MSKLISKQLIEEVRYRNDIADVIGSFIQLKRSSGAIKCLCPFHKEKTPSFTINVQRQIFHCFGCGKGGDVFRFIQEYEGVDFVTAVKVLAQRAGLAIQLEDADAEATSDRQQLLRIHEEITEFYRRCLRELEAAEPARRYLRERELSDDTLDAFLVGYAPDRWDSAVLWGEKRGYSKELMEMAGLVLKKEQENKPARHYDRFRNRIMFPVRDAQSRVIGFSGRTLERDAKGAKYVNSPETLLFHKSRILYALETARRHIVAADAREAIICEGQIDVIRCHQAGFPTAIASQGTAFTEEHARTLARYADGVILVFDSDTAGQDAAIKTSGIFMEASLAVRVATLPKGEDPDSFIRKFGGEAFRQVLERAGSAVAFQVDVLSQREDLGKQVGVMRTAKAVLELVGRSPKAVQRAGLIQEAATRLRLPPSALTDDLKQMLARRRPSGGAAGPAPAATAGDTAATPAVSHNPPLEEAVLCEYMIRVVDHPQAAAWVREFLPLSFFADTVCRHVVQVCLAAWESGRDVDEALREARDSEGTLDVFTAKLYMAPTRVRGDEFTSDDAVKDLILYLWRRKIKNDRDALDRRILAAGEDVDRNLRLQSIQLRNDLKQLERWETAVPIMTISMPE